MSVADLRGVAELGRSALGAVVVLAVGRLISEVTEIRMRSVQSTCYSHGMPTPQSSIPTASVPRALLTAVCDGSGLIVIPTPDGPDLSACFGCRACTSSGGTTPARRAASVAAVFASCADDEPW